MSKAPGSRTISGSLRSLLDLVATLMIIVAGGALTWALVTHEPTPNTRGTGDTTTKDRSMPTLPSEPVRIDDAARIGQVTAPVVVVEYSDFRCPFCARFAQEVLPLIDQKLIQAGTLQLVFKHFPLEGLHPDAPLAAQVAECTRQQGRFKPVHDAFFELPRGGVADFVAIAKGLNVDAKRLDACLANDAKSRVQADQDEARQMGLSGTPAFLFGRLQPDGRVKAVRWQAGMIPARAFEALTQQVLRESQ